MRSLCLLIFISVVINAKDLHIKENTAADIVTEQKFVFGDLSNYDDVFYNENQRYARHVELVTESVLEHLLTEIKKKYPSSKNETGNIPKMMKRLQMKLKRMNKKKLKKHRKKMLYNNNVNASTEVPTN
ncbi:hypothetical protein evm_002614 [Chilo suppressalis]|nr:hypothetical protein evm_002614 [Chilo suppressalis]